MSWFVGNSREMKWWDRGAARIRDGFPRDDNAQVGVNLFVLAPGRFPDRQAARSRGWLP